MKNRIATVAVVVVVICGCGEADRGEEPSLAIGNEALTSAARHGRDVWFKSTFGGERFFGLLLSAPPFNLQLGLDVVLTSDRNTRFNTYGVLNDPDCVQGDATTGYLDVCEDPGSSGVIGLRRFPNPSASGPPVLVGVACAACHGGLHPSNPPVDPNHPAWDNILPTIGNQYLQIGKIFSAHLSPSDPRYQVFQSWAPGTVDTTAIENDHINNPGMITPVFNLPDRPFFDVSLNGAPLHVHRSGQGGEDDVGCERAALRVYFNIGMCAAECMIGHLANGPLGTQTPIDLDECRVVCPDLVDAEQNVGDLCAFLQIPKAPRLQDAPGGAAFIDTAVLDRGKEVFYQACAGCHSNGGPPGHDVLSDDHIHQATGFDPDGEPPDAIGTQRCRSLTTNWAAGHIWATFSSDQYKARPTGGPGFYRDMPLLGVWATAPFFHNNRLGAYTGDFSVAGRVAAFEDAMDQLLNPSHRDFLDSVQRTTDWVSLPGVPEPLPPGTPVNLFANLDPQNPLVNLCPELVENGGHYFGRFLSPSDKYALTEWLKTR